MKTRTLFAISSILAIVMAGGVSSVSAHPQDTEKKNQGPLLQPRESRPEGETMVPGQPGEPGGESVEDLNNSEYLAATAMIDSSVARITVLMKQAQDLSQSFGQLATLHEGADRSEIYMMQRMSDAMGTMAGEIKSSFLQYKKLLAEETTSESGSMKGEIQGLKGVMDGIARQIDQAVQTLQTLKVQLGQA